MSKAPRFDERASHIHTARVLIQEARNRRARSPAFADTLLQWAANARRRAMACRPGPPAQADLFGDADV